MNLVHLFQYVSTTGGEYLSCVHSVWTRPGQIYYTIHFPWFSSSFVCQECASNVLEAIREGTLVTNFTESPTPISTLTPVVGRRVLR